MIKAVEIKSSKFLKRPQEKALRNFLDSWGKRKYIIGILLVGSYAVGLNTKKSDIDVCIILQDSIKYWKRGNVFVNGFLVEYGAYPVSYLKKLQERDLRDRKRLRTRMLATGEILFDKTGLIKKLQEESVRLIKKKLPKQSREIVELNKYSLWDQLDNLKDRENQNKSDFTYAYYACLQNILTHYSSFLRFEIPRPARVGIFISSGYFRKKYYIAEIPDLIFSKLFKKAMQRPSLSVITRLTKHVHERMGGFDINGWNISGRIRI